MVPFGPAWRSIAGGKGTSEIAGDEGFADRSGEQPPSAAHIEHLAFAAKHDRDDFGIAGEAAHRGGAERSTVIQPADRGVLSAGGALGAGGVLSAGGVLGAGG